MRADDDFSLRPIEPEDMCEYCQALDTEAHKDDCPLFLPRCQCGRPGRRYINGQPICPECQRASHRGAA